MTITTTDIVSPVFPTAEVIVLFLSGVAGKTSLSNLFGRFVLKRNDLGGIAFFGVCFAGPVTGFAASRFFLPTTNL